MSKSVWGPATWEMIHCLVLKTNDIDNVNNIESIKNIISSICSNLPCPICSTHATSYLKTNFFSQINNIVNLRMFIFNFHNKVNQRLKKNGLDYSAHISKYNEIKLINVVNNFIKIYNTNSGVTMILYSFHKKQLIQQIKSYFINNIKLYNLK